MQHGDEQADEQREFQAVKKQRQSEQHAENSLRLASLAAEIQGVGTIATQSATSAAAAASASQAAVEVHKAAEATT